MPVIRTADEIHAYIAATADDDFFGFGQEVLLPALPFEEAVRYLVEDHNFTADTWPGRVNADKEARDYYDFALGKAENHRGISASRSITKLRAFAWLLGREDAVTAMDEADYAWYGAPKLKAFAGAMGYPWPSGNEVLETMAQGRPCDVDCVSCNS